MRLICFRCARSDYLSTAGLTTAYIQNLQGPDTEAYLRFAALDAVISNAMSALHQELTQHHTA